jgi:hypothetical protein
MSNRRTTYKPRNPRGDDIAACAEWILRCRELGWPDESLPFLEELWWQYQPKMRREREAESERE